MGLSTQTIPEGLKVENQQPQNDPIFKKILSNVSEVVDTFVNGIKQSAQAQQPHRQIYLAYNGSDLAHIVSKSTLAAGGPIKLPERAEIPTKYKWDLESFYPTDIFLKKLKDIFSILFCV